MNTHTFLPLGYRYVSYIPEGTTPEADERLIYRTQESGKQYKLVKLSNGASVFKEVVFPEFRWDVVRTVAIGPDGTEISWNTVSTCESVCCLLVINGKMLFSLTERIILGGTFWEATAGCIDKGYQPRSAALKELKEEAGFTSDSFTELDLGGSYQDNGKSDELFHYMVLKANSANWVAPELEKGEIIGSKIWLTPEEVLAGLSRMDSGEKFFDGLDVSGHTYAALNTLFRWDLTHPQSRFFFMT